MSVPWVDLTDPEREPSDAELEALMQSVCDKAVERNRGVREQFLANLEDGIARAVKAGAASGLADDRPKEEAELTFEP